MERRGERSRVDRVLDQREATPRLVAVDHEADAQALEVHGLPVAGAQELWGAHSGITSAGRPALRSEIKLDIRPRENIFR
jgi:hypothetical protein